MADDPYIDPSERIYTYICVDGPLVDTRIDRKVISTGVDRAQHAILECPDGRHAYYRERGTDEQEEPYIYGGLWFVKYV